MGKDPLTHARTKAARGRNPYSVPSYSGVLDIGFQVLSDAVLSVNLILALYPSLGSRKLGAASL